MPKSKDIQLVFLPPQGGALEPYTTSEIIADVAGVQRRTINKLIQKHKADFEEFGKVRFEIAPLPGSRTGQNITVYHLNEQQATLLMTYVRNTETVRAFKKELVKQFYAMRALLMERNSPIWQDTRSLTREVRRIEAAAIAELVQYANAQGATAAQWYYATISRLANKTAGITNRDTAHVEQLTALILIERVITEEIRAGISAGKPYKEIYTDLQTRLSGIQALVGHAQAAGAQKTLEAGKDTTETAKRCRKENKHE